MYNGKSLVEDRHARVDDIAAGEARRGRHGGGKGGGKGCEGGEAEHGEGETG